MKRQYTLPGLHAAAGIIPTAAAIAAALLTSGCLRDNIPQCRPLTLAISIADLSYSNAAETDASATLPSGSDFGTICPRVRLLVEDLATGAKIEERELAPDSGTKTAEIALSDSIPYGDYVVTVWGGSSDAATASASGMETRHFSAEGNNDDIFLACDTVSYTPVSPVAPIGLRRTEGLLLIETVNLPEYITSSVVRATNLSSQVDTRFGYSGRMTLSATIDYRTSQTGPRTAFSRIILPPSSEPEATEISARYYSGQNMLQIAGETRVTVGRNRITELRYEWDEAANITVYLRIDGQWERISSLDVTED